MRIIQFKLGNLLVRYLSSIHMIKKNGCCYCMDAVLQILYQCIHVNQRALFREAIDNSFCRVKIPLFNVIFMSILCVVSEKVFECERNVECLNLVRRVRVINCPKFLKNNTILSLSSYNIAVQT